MSLRAIQTAYPWPATMPTVPEDDSGWLAPATLEALQSKLSSSTQLVVECGTWKGRSARRILAAAPNAHLLCIDTWAGSPEHFRVPEWTALLPTLYEGCQRNLWPWRDRVTLIKADSLVGLGLVYTAMLKPDLIYLDSKHSYGRVSAELALCLELFPETPVVGDDYLQADVDRAVKVHVAETGRPLSSMECAFILEPWRQV